MKYQQIKRHTLELINQYSIAGETISPAYNNQSDALSRIPALINDALLEINRIKPDRRIKRYNNVPAPYVIVEKCAEFQDDTVTLTIYYGEESSVSYLEYVRNDTKAAVPLKPGITNFKVNGTTATIRAFKLLYNADSWKIVFSSGHNTVEFNLKETGSTKGSHTGEGWCEFDLPSNFRAMGAVYKEEPGYPSKPAIYQLFGNTIALPPGKYFMEYIATPDLLPERPVDSYDLFVDMEIISAAEYYAAAELVRQDSRYDYVALQNQYETKLSRFYPDIYAQPGTVEDVYNFGVGGMF